MSLCEKIFFNSDISRLNESDRTKLSRRDRRKREEDIHKLSTIETMLLFRIAPFSRYRSCRRERILFDRVHGWNDPGRKFHEQFGIYRESGDWTSGNRRIGCLEGRAAPFKALAEKLHARGIVTGSSSEEEAVSKGNKVWLVNPRLPLGGKTGRESI